MQAQCLCDSNSLTGRALNGAGEQAWALSLLILERTSFGLKHMSPECFKTSLSNYPNDLVIIYIISTQETAQRFSCRNTVVLIYVLLYVFLNYVITLNHLLFQLLIVLERLTSSHTGLWFPSFLSKCACVFLQLTDLLTWHSSLWLRSTQGRFAVLVEGRCMPGQYEPPSLAHYGYGSVEHQSFFMLLNTLNWKGLICINCPHPDCLYTAY